MAIDRLDLRMAQAPWRFAVENAREIAQHWQRIAAAKPAVWNGEVLICTSAEIADGALVATFSATDYASFVAWRDWATPDKTVRNCFGVPVVVSRDGALVMAEMASHTLNAGLVYPPSGSLERRDITAQGRVDIEGSMRLELAEETGLDLTQARAGECVVIEDAHRLAVVRAFHFDADFESLAGAFARHQHELEHAELTGLIAVRAVSDIRPTMPGYAQAIVRHFAKD